MSPEFLLVAVLALGQTNADDQLTVFPRESAESASGMTHAYLYDLADQAFRRRHDRYEALKNADDVRAYSARLREFFVERLGGFPERTPLNARVVGQLDRDGFRVEKIIFESQPRHYVTALLFLPVSQPPYPAVLVPCGHSANGKAADAYQRMCILLAKHGLAAFCYDPIGQGERYQVLDAAGKPRFKSTTEHTLVGVGSILVGRNTASYRVWDGIRSLDYLCRRDDIDARRLGCTGNSGGGTLTEYLMALDDRILCAAPGCCVTTYAARLRTIGPGDAEQNIFGQIDFGLDHADYAIMRAPRPTLLCTATHDFVDIGGVWDIFREAKRIYTRLGYSERVDLVEADAKHGFSRPLRVAVARWMRRWLLKVDEPIDDADDSILSAKEVQCSPRGQVMLIDGARSVMDLNAELNQRLSAHREALWTESSGAAGLNAVRRITGIRKLAAIAKPNVKHASAIQRDGYKIERLLLQSDPNIGLPALLFLPDKSSGDRCLYVHGQGKSVDAGIGGPIEKLVAAGCIVMAIDLCGTGETARNTSNMWGGDWHDIFLAYLLGKSFVAMRAEDILACGRFLSRYHADGKPSRIRLTAIGAAGPPALHAAALEHQLFSAVALSDSITSWSGLLEKPAEQGQLANTVHGALESYDLSDLVSFLRRCEAVEVSVIPAVEGSP